MSSLIDLSTASNGHPVEGDPTSRIVHFDATTRRKEKMRRQAMNGHAPGLPPAAPQSAPRPAAPSAPAQPANGAASIQNGTHAAVAPAPVKPAPQPAPVPPAPATPAAVQPAPAPAPAVDRNGAAHSAPAVSEFNREQLETFMVNFVVEQTGYPAEMVELDADLEADLGIDSIKKAQLFGELAENLRIEVQIHEGMSLDDFPTLRHVSDFLDKSRSNGAAAVQKAPQAAAPIAPAQPAVTPAPQPAAPSVQPVAAAAPAPAPKPAPAAANLDVATLEQFMINFVVEQTGYPAEMVELDADLEADLGIDSIKKAQLFGEMAENLDIRVQIHEGMSLDDFPTLRHVLNFLANAANEGAASVGTTAAPAAPAPKPAAPAAVAPAPAPQPAPVSAAPASKPEATGVGTLNPAELEQFMINFVVEQTGYPPEMVELDADLEADLGIDSIKKAQLFGELAENLNVQVTIHEGMSLDDFPTLRHVTNFLVQNAR